MARDFTSRDARDIAQWHLGILDGLSTKATVSHSPEQSKVKSSFESLERQRYFDTSFANEVNHGINPLSDRAALIPLVSSLYTYRQSVSQSNRCQSLLTKHKSEIEHLLEELEPAYRGLTWTFVSAKSKMAAENAYRRLVALRDSSYGEQAMSATDEADAGLESIADLAWESFVSSTVDFYHTLKDCAGISDGRSRPISAISELLAKYDDALGKANGIARLSDDAVDLVRDASRKMLNAAAERILKEVPVEELSRIKPGIRTNVLRSMGYGSVSDLRAKSVDQLANNDSLGWRAAEDVIRAVKDIEEQAQEGARIRLSSDNKSKEATLLVTRLYNAMRLRGLADAAKNHIAILSASLDDYLDVLRKPLASSSWPFLDERPRATIVEAYKHVSNILKSNDYAFINDAFVDARDIAGAGGSSASKSSESWASFSEDPARFFNLLEEISPGILGSDADFLHGLTKEIVEEIEKEQPSSTGLKCELRRYQQWGVKYILHQGNVLLGDEMGLGKTVEAIASMVALSNAGGDSFLVVCPAGVLPNWCREIEKHSNLRAVKAHGQDKHWDFAEWVNQGGVCVTTYETAGSLNFPEKLKLDMLVVDEAHYVKNPEAKRSRNVADLCSISKRVLFMTGTALENRVDEMITLIDYLNPKVAKEAAKYATFAFAQVFKETIAPVYYRRKRDEVLKELPELIEYDAWCTLSDEEVRDYEYFALKRDRTEMRRVSWTTDAIKRSSKMKRLKEIIQEAKDDGRRAIVFSFYLNTIWDIYEELGDKAMYPITGAISPKQRQTIIDEFNESPSGTVIISQINAGGTGINIQAASVVIICEPQYKPSTENQAISRAYRMGQARNVLVYRLLAENTIDESITALLHQKQSEFDLFADRSVAAKESIEVNDKDLGKLIDEEIERIKGKHGISGEADEAFLEKLHKPSGKTRPKPPEPPAAKSGKTKLRGSDKVPDMSPGSQSSAKASAPTERAHTVKLRRKRSRIKKPKSFSFNVAGVNKQKTGEYWMTVEPSQVTVVREKNNRYDKNAVALHIDGWKAGYVPRQLAPQVASFLDAGYTAHTTWVFTEEVPEKKRYKSEFGGYYYEEDPTKTFFVSSITIVLDEPKSDEPEDQTETPITERKPARPKPLTESQAEEFAKKVAKKFTKRQLEALTLLSQGKTRSDASYAMGIKEGSFQDYAKAIYKKLDVHSKKELYAYARKIIGA